MKLEKYYINETEYFDVTDFSNMGTNIIDYIRIPESAPLYMKIMWLLIDYSKKYKKNCNYMRYSTLVSVLNKIGKYKYNEDRSKLILSHDWCTWEGVRSSIKKLASDGVIKIKREKRRKADVLAEGDIYIFRTIEIDFKRVYELTEEYMQLGHLKPKSNLKKYIKYKFMTLKKFLKKKYDQCCNALKKRYKDAQRMFYNFIYNQNKKLYVHCKNRYYSYVPFEVVDLAEEDNEKFIKYYGKLHEDLTPDDILYLNQHAAPGRKPKIANVAVDPVSGEIINEIKQKEGEEMREALRGVIAYMNSKLI